MPLTTSLPLIRPNTRLTPQLAVPSGAYEALVLPGRAVDLRGIPPVRTCIDVGRRRRPYQRRRGIGRRAENPHRPVGPGVVVGELDDPRVVTRALPVAE